MRPGTGGSMRPGTGGAGYGRPPGTSGGAAAAGGARLGTGMRMPTGMSSGFAGVVGPIADVSISERPVTQQGLGGMRPTTSGPGRQVQDASYFVGVLRQKINEIAVEIGRMKADVDKAGKDSGVLVTYERKYDALIKEVRGLEGDLADYNLSMDKSRTSMVSRSSSTRDESPHLPLRPLPQDASEITFFHAQLKRRNDATTREVDAVFMERADREKGVVRLEDQIAELQRAAEARLNSLPPAQIAEYKTLVADSRALTAQVTALQGELEKVNGAVEAAEAGLRRDKVRDEYALLEKRAAHLRRERVALDDEMATTRLDPADARERLLAKVKEDNARIQSVDRAAKQVEEENAARRKAAADLAADIEERRGEGGESAKYELLFKKDQEMTEFIDTFDAARDKEQAEQARIQNTIAALLEHVSQGIEREASMPSRAQAEEAKDDLSDKARELKASQMTEERLHAELVQRQGELDRIATLDVKISEQLAAKRATMAQQRAELQQLQDVEGLKRAAAEARTALEGRLRDYTRRRDMMRQQVQMVSLELEKRRAQVARDPQAAALEALEGKLKLQEQAVFGLREFISTKGRESDYEGVKADTIRMTAELNAMVQKAQLLIGDI